MALTVASAGDAPVAVLLLLLVRLRVSLRLRCSVLLMLLRLLEALSSRSVSGAAGDLLLTSASRPLSGGKKSLASMDSGVNACSARVTNGRGEDEEAGEAMVVAVASDMGESGDAADSRGQGAGDSAWLPSSAASRALDLTAMVEGGRDEWCEKGPAVGGVSAAWTDSCIPGESPTLAGRLVTSTSVIDGWKGPRRQARFLLDSVPGSAGVDGQSRV